jgi:tetratricopeptide (TPR) repeat protein
MKNISFKSKNWVALAVLLLIITSTQFMSCKKFLEKPIDERTSLSSLEEIEKAIIGLTPHTDHNFTDFMSDDYSYKDIAGHVNRDMAERLAPIFTFDITKRSVARIEMNLSGFNPSTSFLRYYFRINNACLLIDRVNKIEKNATNEKRIDNVLAHAYAIRAYCNFMLTNLFGKQYDTATAESDLAVPFIGEYNANAIVNRPRATVAFMYNEVEKDWLEALKLIDEQNTVTNTKMYFSKKAIYALLSRMYLNKKQWDKSIEYADLLLAIDSRPLPIKTIRNNTVNRSEDYSRQYFDPANAAILMVGGNTFQTISFVNSGYYPYPFMQSYNGMGSGFGDYLADEMIMSSILFQDKMPVKFLYFNVAARQLPTLPIVTVDEVIFNRVEAAVEKEGTLSTDSKTKLSNILDNLNFTPAATTRYKNEVNAVTTKPAAIAVILKIKRNRFFAEGMRWFDIKRHKLQVTHNYDGIDFKIDGTNAEDYVIKLPAEEIQFNPDSNK